MDGEKGIKMMGPEYFTVAAYMPADSGTILCPACGDKAGLPASDQLTQSQFNGGEDLESTCKEAIPDKRVSG
jgi:hypothetical protein